MSIWHFERINPARAVFNGVTAVGRAIRRPFEKLGLVERNQGEVAQEKEEQEGVDSTKLQWEARACAARGDFERLEDIISEYRTRFPGKKASLVLEGSFIGAAEKGQDVVVEKLLATYVNNEDGAASVEMNINSFAEDGNKLTALHHAVRKGHERCVEVLVNAKGIDLEARSLDRGTALHYAGSHSTDSSECRVVELLLAAGADIEGRNSMRGTPLYSAAEKGNFAVVKKLLAAGADVTVHDQFQRTPLDMAVKYNHTAVANLLRDAEPANRPSSCAVESPAPAPAANVASQESGKTCLRTQAALDGLMKSIKMGDVDYQMFFFNIADRKGRWELCQKKFSLDADDFYDRCIECGCTTAQHVPGETKTKLTHL